MPPPTPCSRCTSWQRATGISGFDVRLTIGTIVPVPHAAGRWIRETPRTMGIADAVASLLPLADDGVLWLPGPRGAPGSLRGLQVAPRQAPGAATHHRHRGRD